MVERRLTCLAVIVLLWGAAILKNLISLQIVHHREYAVKARSIQEVAVEIPPLEVPVLDIHAGGGANAGEGEHHEADERPITETDDGRRVDSIEELARL